jgi:hypothetical protein
MPPRTPARPPAPPRTPQGRPDLTAGEAKAVVALCAGPFAAAAPYYITHRVPVREVPERLAEVAEIVAAARRNGYGNHVEALLPFAIAARESPGPLAGALFATLKAEMCPVISSHLPPNPKSTAAGTFRRAKR